ncbi:SNF2 family N-terminal domain-containing protein [Cytidiella melzeri]|nr:SNF2 family N-terminal domain-containing protein [Cytidiella melzeri]
MSKNGRYGKGHGGRALCGVANTDDDVEEKLKQERERLIRERQGDVNEVLNKHDDLLRELFHLEKFVSLLSFNPQEAKKDTSQVFQIFKMSYDLVDHTSTVGPSRTTRRAHTERLQSLKADPIPARTTAFSRKEKAVAKGNGPLWALLAEAKTKGKVSTPSESISAPPGRRSRFKATNEQSLAAPSSTSDAEASVTATPHRRRTLSELPGDFPPFKKRKLDTQTTEHDLERVTVVTARSSESFKGSKRAAAITDYTQEEQPKISTNSIPRRVKLIVRRPPPLYSNPRQKPPRPQFGSSIDSYLKSYIAPEGQELNGDAYNEAVKKQLMIWRQVDALRRQGRMLHRPPDNHFSSDSQAKGPQRTPDLWDQVITEVKERSRIRYPVGKHVAAQVAGRIRSYWDAQAVKDEKTKAQEEKRLRALAKATIRLVTAKWKEAVFYIREQERKEREAEERRRGHEHLDAILDQSGHILEAQQVDLTRADEEASRSRSTSSSETPERQTSTSPPSDVAYDSEDTGSGAEESEDDDEVEIDSTQLVSTPDDSSRGTSLEKQPPFPSQRNGQVSPSASPKGSRISFMNISTPTPHSSFKEHRSTTQMSRLESADDLEGGMIAQFPRPLLQWDEEPSIASPISHAINLPESSSGRSSVVPDSIPELQDDHLDDLLDAGDEVPPDTPTSAAFDTVFMPPLCEKEEMESAPHTDITPPVDRTSAVSAIDTAGLPELPDEGVDSDDEVEDDSSAPAYLRPYAVAPVSWDSEAKVKPPLLLRGTLRPYQQAGLEWLASLHTNHLNGILADEMGLGKTIQTISLLAHLACDRGIWGPHLIIVPTSVLLNWEMEFKKFLPGFKVLSYHGNTKRRKELRQGWNNKYQFNVCVTSYTLASRDANVFKRKAWYYMILDEAHMIKNFKSQRWNILLMFRSFRRLLLTGTPLQNNLTELWALLQFLMSGTNFANVKEFGEWFSNPLEKAIEMGSALDDDNLQRVAKLHTVLRPYLLRRLKRDVEKELPSKFEHLVMCPLSKRQRFLYDEFMARAATRHDLQSGVYHKIANILMQLRKVVNHPDLFEVRPITTSFAMSRSAIADYEIKELLVRRHLLRSSEDQLNLGFLGFHFTDDVNTSVIAAVETSCLDSTSYMPLIMELPEAPPQDTRTIQGYLRYKAHQRQVDTAARWRQIAYINHRRCNRVPVLSSEVVTAVRLPHSTLTPLSILEDRSRYLDTVHRVHAIVKSHADRKEDMSGVLDHFAFVTPAVVARDMAAIALAGHEEVVQRYAHDCAFDAILHHVSVKLQIAFPDPSLLQYDCGKLQELARLLRDRKAGGHRVLIFTQMTRVLDILETFLNYHGYLYLRLDGATKIEDRQYITERFNTDSRIFCFISSSRSGGVGINLTGADTVIFYDSDFNPQMDRQCEDRAHRIGQIRDVHIYRFVSRHTVEEALLRKANQKRSLDDIVIQRGEFDWRTLFRDEGALTKALGEVEDTEDAHAAAVAAREAIDIEGADAADFAWEGNAPRPNPPDESREVDGIGTSGVEEPKMEAQVEEDEHVGEVDEGVEGDEEEGGTTEDYMLSFVRLDMAFFSDWRLPGFKE